MYRLYVPPDRWCVLTSPDGVATKDTNIDSSFHCLSNDAFFNSIDFNVKFEDDYVR